MILSERMIPLSRLVECINDLAGNGLRYTYLRRGQTYEVQYEQGTTYVIRTPMGLTNYPKSRFKVAEVHYVPTQEGDKADDI
jgi:hypothetical protein